MAGIGTPEQREKAEADLSKFDVSYSGAKFLMLHGWEAQGEITNPFVKWVDPLAPKEGKTEYVIKMAPHRNGVDKNKQPLWEDRPVQHKDANGAMVPVKQPHVTFPGREYTTDQAIVIQKERNAEERRRHAKEKEAKKEKKEVAQVA